MYLELTNQNCFGTLEDQATSKIIGILFDNTQQVDRMIEDLEDLKRRQMKEKQKEYDRKHQLTLDFES